MRTTRIQGESYLFRFAGFSECGEVFGAGERSPRTYTCVVRTVLILVRLKGVYETELR
jgi:hypothetical protein